MDLGRLLVSVFIVEAQQFMVDDDDITRSVELGEVKVSYLIQFVTEFFAGFEQYEFGLVRCTVCTCRDWSK